MILPRVEEIEKHLRPALEAQGFELVEAQYLSENRQWVLRVFVDKLQAGETPGKGVSLADCEYLSNTLDLALADSGILTESYVLEISSPGINRALKTEAHFKRFVGKKVKVELFEPLTPEGKQRNFSGLLSACKEQVIEVEDVVSGKVTIPLKAIRKANLQIV